ncbi:MAG: energy-coupling factor transporter transmembrane protein EcfT [Planctomycetes bacterium]|nr:energy-coupling factor transporter transmembrane protein EcfT [Planctomycetota bacterium]
MRLFNRNATSPLGRLDVRLKMAIAFSMSLLVVLVDSVPMLATVAVAGVLLFLLGWPNVSQVKLVCVTLALVVWGLMLSQGIFYSRFPRHALVVLVQPNWLFADGLKVYAEGLHHGLVQSLRFTAMGLAGYAICFSTEPDRFLRGLLAMRVPFSLSFMAVSAIRFLPLVAEEFRAVRTAMRMKGYRPFRGGLRDTIRVEVAGLRPVLAGTIRRSQEVALSILTRGFTLDAKRTSLYHERFRAWHWVALTGMITVVGAIGLCKVLFWLYEHEVYYAAGLRPLYSLVRNWL